MKERPILFSGPMVRVLLEGRKTQTRRVVKPQPQESFTEDYGPSGVVEKRVSYGWSWWPSGNETSLVCCSGDMLARCPYGLPGDRLIVRETLDNHLTSGLVYDADRAEVKSVPPGASLRIGKVPSIHMPRWASRITLEVVSVRVERVDAITEADAIAEGLEWQDGDGGGPGSGFKWKGRGYHGGRTCDAGKLYHTPSPDGRCSCVLGGPSPSQCAFLELFYDLNERAPKGSNPWVWVVEFKRVDNTLTKG